MQIRGKLVLAGLGAALVLCAAVGSATANRISFNDRAFRIGWQPLTVRASGEFGSVEIRCNATIEGSFHAATMTKVARSLIGYITRATTEATTCAGEAGIVRLLSATLPWHVQYEGFAGTLPAITEIDTQLIGLGISAEIAGGLIRCLARTTETAPLRERAMVRAGIVSGLLGGEGTPIPASGQFCEPGTINASGTGTVTRLGLPNRSLAASLI